MSATERFVSLYGFFSFEYPKQWKSEVDDAGNYLFTDELQGAGALRVNVFENDDREAGAEERFFETILAQQQESHAYSYTPGKQRFIRFIRQHDVQGSNYTVHYWVTIHQTKIVMLTYTMQSNMIMHESTIDELAKIEALLATFEFMEEQPHHHH